MKYNAPQVAMGIAVIELLATNPADTDFFCITLPDKGALEKACQWCCSLPYLELEDIRPMQRSYNVDALRSISYSYTADPTLMLQPATKITQEIHRRK